MRPLAKLVGQSLAVELLERAVATNRIAPAYLFVGPSGVGKALAARCFAEMLLISPQQDYQRACQRLYNGNHPDFLWVEPTYNDKGELLTAKQAEERGLKRKTTPQIRIEQIRSIVDFLSRPPLESERSVVVIEGADYMAEAAGNALLKTLEEPGNATLILIANNTNSLLPTLVSRCQIVPFFRLSEEDLKYVLCRAHYPEILEYPHLIQLAEGAPGKAISDWQKLRNIPQDLISKILKLPDKVVDAFLIAKRISNELELDTQIWLADYLQSVYWEKERKPEIIHSLEKVKKLLFRYVQPRLVWECFFLENIPETLKQ
ncbi:MAG: DNA polymerase III subunit delta' [Geminocystis sp.]|nr:DNA polymerase III subunit delta' [Geminocystis sp.]HIK37323.1 AAA family ATPase [Geminocystis sp. M7585_C2015_104]MCS7148280.1 DNA polymerase III subunit delta' [Geminocystis sp.]MCX8077695.1 DNA polymerase III subunit delta' [Geminocystis sp.]MDW8116587.1 DNA polymerase III subunit delta' [Geminocystis sp.]